MTTTAKNYTRRDPVELHDVRENARKLAILYTVEVEIARLAGLWLPKIREMPEKLWLGRMLYEDAEHAMWIEKRLEELRVPPDLVATFRTRTAPAFKAMEETDDPELFMRGLLLLVKPALLADYQRHIEACPPYVDDPSIRFLKRIVEDEKEHLAKGLSLLASRASGHALPAGALWDLSARSGDFLKGQFVGQEPRPQPMPNWPQEVEHLPAVAPMPLYPGDFKGDMQRVAHDLVFSELEAAEIFARYVYEYHQCPWQFHYEAARIAWDECRHVELLLNVLDRYEGRVGQFPAKAPGFEEFMQLKSPVERMIMVSVIAEGEVSTDTQTQHRDAFRQMGDEFSALLKDYEMADEVSHGQFGERWARKFCDQMGEDYDLAYENAHAALERFKAQHPEAEGESAIPLVRLGADEAGEKRTINVTAKRLLGYSDERIRKLVAESGGRMVEEDTL
ncbi:ferritin-like domain-containing protein [Nitratireductor indicus]|uniref:Ferritin-like domain-containing protein n=1 Tax=Nitratireductor indicus C115 TaxID=1231190 RepID=K2PI12_9HYPH|nr:DUF455 family protein [Nitratireductor indicus]EKF40787.1 hypothetical protein NA8A_19318 [Nitratireductor indicus C115]MDS1136381.1 DUF455 family protein [Nitratireductor indicus]SFQ75468.1 Protein of unknown function [Nitratireductor indicus]